MYTITARDTGTGAPNYTYQFAITRITSFMNNDLGAYNVLPIGYTAILAPGTGDEQGAISNLKDNIYGEVLFQHDPVESRDLVFMESSSSDDNNDPDCCWCSQQQSKTRLWLQDNRLWDTTLSYHGVNSRSSQCLKWGNLIICCVQILSNRQVQELQFLKAFN